MKNKIIAVIGIIALSLIIINMSASHSKLSKTVNSKNVISMRTSFIEYNFDYTGGEQTFTVPTTGTYKLETWGAQGGEAYVDDTNNQSGGYGAYSIGNVKLSQNQKIYVVIGGSGKKAITGENTEGGFNGGGQSGKFWNAGNDYDASGGGATHIATIPGLLSSLENNKKSILIVSGAGGGSSRRHDTIDGIDGGNGGGIIGNSSSVKNNSNVESTGWNSSLYATGGTQTSGGTSGYSSTGYTPSKYIEAGFGIGGYVTSTDSINVYQNGPGGGAGYYGGGFGGGGGSGYIGNTSLTDKHMTCYNCETSNEESTKTISNTCVSETPTSDCSKIGNGYAKITYLGN